MYALLTSVISISPRADGIEPSDHLEHRLVVEVDAGDRERARRILGLLDDAHHAAGLGHRDAVYLLFISRRAQRHYTIRHCERISHKTLGR